MKTKKIVVITLALVVFLTAVIAYNNGYKANTVKYVSVTEEGEYVILTKDGYSVKLND